ncbi:DUF3999 family protein, partial [Pseudomonas sp. EGD-AK9]|uniref:DUF3999 family protein n=1 Tax=Pseudomonas sp. EGD-AK9 TaxID=1386078 RepID=UPI0004CDEB9A
GHAGAQSAALPLASLIPGYRPERLAGLGRAELGELASQAQPASGEPPRDWQHFGLWAVLLLGVGLLATMAASLLRRPPNA